MKYGLQLLTANKFSLFCLGRGVRERWCRSPLPGVGKPAMVVVRVQGAPRVMRVFRSCDRCDQVISTISISISGSSTMH